jgi:hypothetical protein
MIKVIFEHEYEFQEETLAKWLSETSGIDYERLEEDLKKAAILKYAQQEGKAHISYTIEW